MKRTALFLTVGAAVMLMASGAMAKKEKVEICHVPPDNPANAHTINVSENALPDHFGHGDTPGACECQVNEDCTDENLCDDDLCVQGKCQHAPICAACEGCDPGVGQCVPPPPANSCEERCGDYDVCASCQCDALCTDFNDCCADFEAVCADSCEWRCGIYNASLPCQCDPPCLDPANDDCCADFLTVCEQ